MAAQTEVTGIGSCTVDFFALVPKLIGAEEKVNATRLEIHAGGVTANNLTQVARLGASAGWLGLIGEDENGRIIQKEFAADGMDLSGIEVVPGEQSSLTWIPVDAQGERCIYMFPNVTGRITPQQVRERFAAHIRASRHFHTEASQLPLAPVEEAMHIAKDAGVRVIFDLDVAPSDFASAGLGSVEALAAALRFADVLKPCKAAARELTGESDYEKMARGLLRLGPELVAITLGGDGCLIARQTRLAHVPALKASVTDTTGAGDAFMGGLSYALLQGWSDDQAGLFANACAALCCTQVGARAMSPRAEVEAYLRAQRPKGAASF